MHKLGMEDRSGGRHGERARLKNQMDRLFSSSVQLDLRGKMITRSW